MAYPYLQDLLRELFGISISLPIPMFGTFVAIAVFTGIHVIRLEVLRLERVGLISSDRVKASDLMIEYGMLSVLAGMIGARVFHILEYPEQFMRDPAGMIFSRGGFSILGGLIVGTTTGALYLRRKGLPVLRMADASAIGLMWGYAVGRIGCHLSGDGDWGIASDLSQKPGWLPDWLWAYPHTNNIVGARIEPPGVYPTSIYESALGFLMFGILIACRKHPYRGGWLFSLYLLMNGVVRFFVEKIRVNSKYHIFGLSVTQAEILSVLLAILGAAGLVIFSRRVNKKPARAKKKSKASKAK